MFFSQKKCKIGPDALYNAQTTQIKNTGQVDQAEKFQDDFVQQFGEMEKTTPSQTRPLPVVVVATLVEVLIIVVVVVVVVGARREIQ